MMTLPTVSLCVEDGGDGVSNCPGSPDLCYFNKMPHLPDCGYHALVRVEDGKAVDPESLRGLLPSGSVLVMRQDGKWQGAVRTVEKAMLANPGREPLAVLDALAEDAS